MDWNRVSTRLNESGLADERIRVHLSYLRSAHEAARPELFSDYVAWRRSVDHNETGVAPVEHELGALLEAIRRVSADDPAPLVDELIELLSRASGSVAPEEPAPHLTAGGPCANVALRYFELVTHARRREATTLILQALDDGLVVPDLYLEVFQPCLREVGRRWQLGELTVGEEHYFTAVTQSIMAQVYPRIFAVQPTREPLVAASIEGNIHELGIRMVADFFELEGWDTHYLGADTPTAEILAAVLRRRPRLLALSVALGSQVRELADLIRRIRVRSELADLKVLVGGNGLLRLPPEERTVGADAFAADAREALRMADELVA